MIKRTFSITLVLILIITSLVARIYDISVNNTLKVTAANSLRSRVIATTRGNIYDRNLKKLTNTKESYVTLIKPVAESLSEIKKFDLKNAENELKKGHLAITKSENKNQLKQSENILTLKTYERYEDNSLCHILGYCTENEGVYGVEKYFNDILKENSGELTVKYHTDALGRMLNGEKVEINNNNYNNLKGLVLTIDKNIQIITEKALESNNITKGCAIVLDVKTNEILALASTPVFDRNNLENALNSENSPFMNRAFEAFSVGSVFKVVTAAAALEENMSDFNINCEGKTSISGNTFFCNKRDGHGKMNLENALSVSCNPYFIELSVKVGKEKLLKTALNLGFNKATDFGNGYITKHGNLPIEKELNSDASIGNLGFGQGSLLATPLQVAVCYSVIASNGNYIEPTLIKGFADENRKIINAASPKERKVLKSETCEELKKYLLKTVKEGTGKPAESEYFSSCGKTATAESGQFNENGTEIKHSWFVGFFPYENPEYVICVMKENGASGSSDDAPVFKEISENIYFLKNPELINNPEIEVNKKN